MVGLGGVWCMLASAGSGAVNTTCSIGTMCRDPKVEQRRADSCSATDGSRQRSSCLGLSGSVPPSLPSDRLACGSCEIGFGQFRSPTGCAQ